MKKCLFKVPASNVPAKRKLPSGGQLLKYRVVLIEEFVYFIIYCRHKDNPRGIFTSKVQFECPFIASLHQDAIRRDSAALIAHDCWLMIIKIETVTGPGGIATNRD
jgi:hypothetical protein